MTTIVKNSIRDDQIKKKFVPIDMNWNLNEMDKISRKIGEKTNGQMRDKNKNKKNKKKKKKKK